MLAGRPTVCCRHTPEFVTVVPIAMVDGFGLLANPWRYICVVHTIGDGLYWFSGRVWGSAIVLTWKYNSIVLHILFMWQVTGTVIEKTLKKIKSRERSSNPCTGITSARPGWRENVGLSISNSSRRQFPVGTSSSQLTDRGQSRNTGFWEHKPLRSSLVTRPQLLRRETLNVQCSLKHINLPLPQKYKNTPLGKCWVLGGTQPRTLCAS